MSVDLDELSEITERLHALAGTAQSEGLHTDNCPPECVCSQLTEAWELCYRTYWQLSGYTP